MREEFHFDMQLQNNIWTSTSIARGSAKAIAINVAKNNNIYFK